MRSDQGLNISWFDENIRAMRNHLRFLGELSRQYEHVGTQREYKRYKLIYKLAIRDAKIRANKGSKQPY